jgi:hypothetical protein
MLFDLPYAPLPNRHLRCEAAPRTAQAGQGRAAGRAISAHTHLPRDNIVPQRTASWLTIHNPRPPWAMGGAEMRLARPGCRRRPRPAAVAVSTTGAPGLPHRDRPAPSCRPTLRLPMQPRHMPPTPARGGTSAARHAGPGGPTPGASGSGTRPERARSRFHAAPAGQVAAETRRSSAGGDTPWLSNEARRGLCPRADASHHPLRSVRLQRLLQSGTDLSS